MITGASGLSKPKPGGSDVVPDLAVILGCLCALGVAGGREIRELRRAWAAIPIRIHVNGTRGKSAVTRAIWAGLRASGLRVFGKTTGTAARLLMPNGEEHPLARVGPPNIREQVAVLRRARQLGAEAVVLECMALRPHLQWISEHRILRSTVGVITNVRLDHGEIMGSSHAEVACALANTVPRRATLVLGEEIAGYCLRQTAEADGSEVIEARRDAAVVAFAKGLATWEAANLSLALAVTRLLGVPDEMAAPAMLSTPADPGRVRTAVIRQGEFELPCLDASAANDLESLNLLLADFLAGVGDGRKPVLLVFNHRRDRPCRLQQILAGAPTKPLTATLIITGERPALQQTLNHRRRGQSLFFVRRSRLRQEIARRLCDHCAVVMCGNSRGIHLGDVGGF